MDDTHEMARQALERSTQFEAFGTMLSFWAWPIAALELWTSMIGAPLLNCEPQIDRDDHTAQLPIPNPLQKAKDSDLFA